jgi:tRNA nucleotidyltransferase/poly(A) polymerase
MDISEQILSDPLSRWVLLSAKNRAYLVGGYVRDLLRNRISGDRDFVIDGDAALIAEKAARKFRGTFIKLHDQTFRVALKNGQFADFTRLSKGILNDLGKRDFTVNAIAWSPDSGIVAPSGHLSDLSDKTIRVVNHKNLLHDPLRIIRAYRLSAQLQFTIDPDTSKYLSIYAPLITEAAPERITEELFKLLNHFNCLYYLRLCNKHKVLPHVMGLSQRLIYSNLSVMSDFDQLLIKLSNQPFYRDFLHSLNQKLSQGLKGIGLVRLYFLTRCRNKAKLTSLKLSTGNNKSLECLRNNEKFYKKRFTDKFLLNLYKRAGVHIYEMAAVLSTMKKRSSSRVIERAKHYMKIKSEKLINGEDIMRVLNIESGPDVGEIKERIIEHQYHGIIRTKREAMKWIISNLT